MSPNELRIILLVLGVFLIAGIYFWEKRKSGHARKSARAALFEDHEQEHEYQHEFEDELHDDEVLTQHLRELETLVRKDGITIEETIEEIFVDENIGDEALVPEEPEEILLLSIVSRRKYFTGDAIMSAMRSTNLHAGEDDIFYRYTNDDRHVLYGVANMVEPGVFPLADMSRFTTPGITLFATLPGPLEGRRIFDDMYETAEQLSAFLDGVIQDGAHHQLDEEKLDHMRELADKFSRQ